MGVFAVVVQSVAQTKLDITWLDERIQQVFLSSRCEGLALVQMNNKWGYINKEGKVVIEPQFDEAEFFNEGLARVQMNNKWGYINKEGKIVIEPQFKNGFDFNEGLARVQMNDKWGYINKEGKVVIKLQFYSASDFNEGLARVEMNDKWGYINKEGKVVVEPQFDEAKDFQVGLALVKLNGKWGILRKPLSDAVQEKSMEQAGLFVGTVSKVTPGVILVEGNTITVKVSMGEKLCLYSGDSIIILRSTSSMMTVTKCGLVSGNLKDIKLGMKVYRYSGGKEKK
jgi:predicted DNA-binding WGR domain protein